MLTLTAVPSCYLTISIMLFYGTPNMGQGCVFCSTNSRCYFSSTKTSSSVLRTDTTMNEWMNGFQLHNAKKTTFETWNNHIVCVHYASTTQYTLALQKMYCICALVWMGTIHAFVWKAATQFEQDHTELSARASHSYLNCSPVTRTSAMRSSSAAFFCIVFPIPSISLQLLK